MTFTGLELTGERRALVLGGGGPVGLAWQSGLVSKLVAEGMLLRSAELILGTSAGAISGARLALDLTSSAPPSAQSTTARKPSDADGLPRLIKALAEASQSPTPEIKRREIGRMALEAVTASEEQSIQRVGFLAKREWPSNFRATAVNVRTGENVVWHRGSDVPLELAVASSCALPGVWPPVTINGERYMDGGVRSMLNADLAADYASVIVVSCFALVLPARFRNPDQELLNAKLEAEIARLREGGARVNVIVPSADLLDLTQYGAKMLDISLASNAFQIGVQQAIQATANVDALWRPA
jgi:NTE family protein